MSQQSIRNLPSEHKVTILSNHFKPDVKFNFPSRYFDGCNRACQHKYLEDNPWFVYSKAEDGIFCLPCVLFANKGNLGAFVCEKFNNWTKKTKKFAEHNSTKYHQFAILQAELLKSTYHSPETAIDNRLKGIHADEIAKNRSIIKSIADAILFCGRQGIALRGHRDDSTADPNSNKGNFIALLNYSANNGNATLAQHLNEAMKNATYTSKTTQNELIEAIGDQLRNAIIQEVKAVKWFSIQCDEVSDVSNKEQVSIVLRYVDLSNTIREDFVDFVAVERITGEVLAAKIKDVLAKLGLSLQDCRGQGYDGATNMSGRHGVQGILSADNPLATYIHCNAHVLNLCIMKACSLPFIKTMNAAVTETANFLHNSPKRQHFFEAVVDGRSKVVKVKDLCRTRWVYRHEAYENFYMLYKYLVATMIAITEHDQTYGDMKWDSNTVVGANGFLKVYTTYQFIVFFHCYNECHVFHQAHQC